MSGKGDPLGKIRPADDDEVLQPRRRAPTGASLLPQFALLFATSAIAVCAMCLLAAVVSKTMPTKPRPRRPPPAAEAVAPPAPSMGEWRRVRVVDGMEGTSEPAIELIGTPALVSAYGQLSTVYLDVRCVRHRTQVLVEHGAVVEPRVRWKVDDNKVETLWPSQSDDFQVLVVGWGPSRALDLLGAKYVKYEVTPTLAPTQIVTFHVEGFDEAVRLVREACDW